MHVVAIITAKLGSIDFVQTELTKFIEPTHQENGCVSYQLTQDRSNPANFVFIEEWKSKQHLDDHLTTPHITTGLEKMEGHLEAVQIFELDNLA